MDRRGMLSGLLGLIPGLAALGLVRRTEAAVQIPTHGMTSRECNLSGADLTKITDAVVATPQFRFCNQVMDVPKENCEYMLRAVRNGRDIVFEWVPIRRMQVESLSDDVPDSFGVMS